MKKKDAGSKRRIPGIGVTSSVMTLGALGLLLIAAFVSRGRARGPDAV
jgi:hypothetical protein